MMRLFIAIDISKELKEEVVRLQKKLVISKNIKLVTKENFHFTLKFLGDKHSPEKVIEILDTINFETFFMTDSNIGFFPNDKKIKVVWLGFEHSSELMMLQRVIEDKLKTLFKKEFEFIPHLTIARIKYLSPEENNKLRQIKNKNIKKFEFKIDSFKLIKSTLTDKVPMYETLKEFKAKAL